MADNDSELSFNPNDVVTDGKFNQHMSNYLRRIIRFQFDHLENLDGYVLLHFVCFDNKKCNLDFSLFQLIGTINGKTGLIPENYISFTSGV